MTDFTLETAQSWLRKFAHRLEAEKEYLTELDSPIGDADHGTNMARGMNAAAQSETLEQPDLGLLFKKVGMTLVSKVGGTSGPLYGTFFLRAGKEVDTATCLDATGLSAALHAGLLGILDRGKAELGDKTMVDALTPALTAFDDALAAGESLVTAVSSAALAAQQGAAATIPLLAKKGRASYLGERSVGHQDPGATSVAFMLQALAQAVSGKG